MPDLTSAGLLLPKAAVRDPGAANSGDGARAGGAKRCEAIGVGPRKEACLPPRRHSQFSQTHHILRGKSPKGSTRSRVKQTSQELIPRNTWRQPLPQAPRGGGKRGRRGKHEMKGKRNPDTRLHCRRSPNGPRRSSSRFVDDGSEEPCQVQSQRLAAVVNPSFGWEERIGNPTVAPPTLQEMVVPSLSLSLSHTYIYIHIWGDKKSDCYAQRPSIAQCHEELAGKEGNRTRRRPTGKRNSWRGWYLDLGKVDGVSYRADGTGRAGRSKPSSPPARVSGAGHNGQCTSYGARVPALR